MAIVVKTERRDAFGTNAARRIRVRGKIPAILYGQGTESIPLVLDKKDIFQIMRTDTRENTIFRLALGAEERDAMIKALQVDPTTDELIHADLIQIAMDKLLRVSVPITPVGESVGVKTEGGFVDIVTRQVEIECLPKDIPEHFDIDIAGLHINQSFKAGDMTPPAGVRILSDPATVLVLIATPHKEEVAAEAKPEEGVEVAAAAEPKEPELIKKERAAEDKEGKEPKKESKEKKEK
ncbi:MAG: 50S ribosomal protein L25 [Candidatus Aminicenantes bacterium]|nr:50S ribosomal protein L25 [Candidatus Aminicenantes bacterium]